LNDDVSSSNYVASNDGMIILGKLWNGNKGFWPNLGKNSFIFLEWQRNDMKYLRQYSLHTFGDSKRAPLGNNKKAYSSVKFLHTFINGKNSISDILPSKKSTCSAVSERLYSEMFVTSNHCNKFISCKYC
jgi:hypothetical protein